jgi:hypothetical protein
MHDDRRAGGVRWVNAGSVGMPFDGRAGRAFWALLGDSVELRATPFDVETTIAAVEATRADGVEDLVDQLRAQPTRADASEHFERLAVGGG